MFRDELFDMCNLVLLLLVRLHLVDLILLLRPHVCGIVTGVIHHLAEHERQADP